MSQTILQYRSSSSAITPGTTTLAFGKIALTNIGGVSRLYIGDSSNVAREIAGAAYALLASPALTGTPTAPTATSGTNTTQIATTEFVTAAVAAAVAGGVNYKGSIDCSANPNYPAASQGDMYVVSVAGKIGGASGEPVQAGDFIFCNTTNGGGDQATVGADFDVVQGNIDLEALAGAGLVVSGAALDVNADGVTIEINGSNQVVIKAGGVGVNEISSAIAGSGLTGGSGSALAVSVDGTTLEVSGGDVQIKNDGVGINQISSSIAGNGLTGGSGSALSINADTTTSSSTVANAANVSSNGLGIKIDGSSVTQNGSNQLQVATVDGGTF